MSKAIVIGYDNRNNLVITDGLADLGAEICEPDSFAVEKKIDEEKPDLLIVNAEKGVAPEEFFFVFEEKCPNTPVIIIGSQEVHDSLDELGCLSSEWVRFVDEPAELKEIRKCADEFFTLVEQSKASAERKKKAAEERKNKKSGGAAKASSGSSSGISPAETDSLADLESASDRRKHSVLLVDDSPAVLRAMHGILCAKYNVSFATSGAQAISTIAKSKPDIILLDYEMPEMDGKTTFEMIRMNPETKDIPVIFLTGIADFEHVFNAVVMRPQGYLLKPCTEERLFSEISKVLGD